MALILLLARHFPADGGINNSLSIRIMARCERRGGANSEVVQVPLIAMAGGKVIGTCFKWAAKAWCSVCGTSLTGDKPQGVVN